MCVAIPLGRRERTQDAGPRRWLRANPQWLPALVLPIAVLAIGALWLRGWHALPLLLVAQGLLAGIAFGPLLVKLSDACGLSAPSRLRFLGTLLLLTLGLGVFALGGGVGAWGLVALAFLWWRERPALRWRLHWGRCPGAGWATRALPGVLALGAGNLLIAAALVLLGLPLVVNAVVGMLLGGVVAAAAFVDRPFASGAPSAYA